MTLSLTTDVLITPAARQAAMIDDVRRGLTSVPKTIPPVWFYDEAGSLLFDEITRLPEYYLTRAERTILEARSAQIAEAAGPSTLVEIGSGTSEKTRILLDAMAAAGNLVSISLFDISEEIMQEAAAVLSARYDVDVHAVVGDFRSDLPKLAADRPQLWAFLGSTIGNFTPPERRQVLSDFRLAMGDQDRLLVGTDLVKDPRRLIAAYDDAAGVTAAFNKNVLRVLNASLDADFDLDRFEHRAVWNGADSWIEMRLRSTVQQSVHVAGLGLVVDLAEGEEILTEISSKFHPDRIDEEFSAAGLTVAEGWTDPAGDFRLSLTRPILEPR